MVKLASFRKCIDIIECIRYFLFHFDIYNNESITRHSKSKHLSLLVLENLLFYSFVPSTLPEKFKPE